MRPGRAKEEAAGGSVVVAGARRARLLTAEVRAVLCAGFNLLVAQQLLVGKFRPTLENGGGLRLPLGAIVAAFAGHAAHALFQGALRDKGGPVLCGEGKAGESGPRQRKGVGQGASRAVRRTLLSRALGMARWSLLSTLWARDVLALESTRWARSMSQAWFLTALTPCSVSVLMLMTGTPCASSLASASRFSGSTSSSATVSALLMTMISGFCAKSGRMFSKSDICSAKLWPHW